jgi:hypothetical protein
MVKQVKFNHQGEQGIREIQSQPKIKHGIYKDNMDFYN